MSSPPDSAGLTTPNRRTSGSGVGSAGPNSGGVGASGGSSGGGLRGLVGGIRRGSSFRPLTEDSDQFDAAGGAAEGTVLDHTEVHDGKVLEGGTERTGFVAMEMEPHEPQPISIPEGICGARKSYVVSVMIVVLVVAVIAVAFGLWETHHIGGGGNNAPPTPPVGPVLGLDSFVLNATVNPNMPSFVWSADGKAAFTSDEQGIWKVSGTDGTKSLFAAASAFVTPGTTTPLPFFDFWVSPDETYVLFAINKASIWRHSYTAVYVVWHVSDKVSTWLTTSSDALLLAQWSPAMPSTTIALVRANNVYLRNVVTNVETAVTTTGSADLIHGIPDWSYEEEVFETRTALWWSPDGTRLAYGSFNVSQVPPFKFAYFNGQPYASERWLHYPCPGFANAEAFLSVYTVNGAKTSVMDMAADGLFATNRYILTVNWAYNTELVVRTVNRGQNVSTLLGADVSSGQASIAMHVVQTLQDAAWIDPHTSLTLFTSGTSRLFIDLVVMQDFKHLVLYEYGYPAQQMCTLTDGSWQVNQVVGLSASPLRVYFLSTLQGSTTQTLGSVGIALNMGASTCSTTGVGGQLYPDYSWQSASFNADSSAFFLYVQGPGVPQSILVNAQGTAIALETNADHAAYVKALNMPTVEFLQVPSADASIQLNAYMILPPGFNKDTDSPAPLLMYMYGGPGSQSVTTSYFLYGSRAKWLMYMASQGYLVACVDNRGTGGRGQSFMQATYLNLGHLEALDQIAAVNYFGTLRFVDKARIGLWGWSYGGYMTSKVMSTPSNGLRMGMAVAPVTDWRFYDSIYTERYMRTPQANPTGYATSSVLPYAKNVPQYSFLLVHGSGDDNVHYVNSAEFAAALVANQVVYDMMVYTNQAHGLSSDGAQYHIWRLLTRFVASHL